LSYACAWGVGSDRHRGVTLDLGVTVDTSLGEVWAGFYDIWQTRAGALVIFYALEDDLAYSSNYGVDFTVVADILPGVPANSGQSLQMHFLVPDNMLMVDSINDVYYSVVHGLTWTAVPVSPDGAYCVAPCGDPTRYPDGKAFLLGATAPTLDTQWIWLTDDLGQTFVNKTGNLGSFLEHGVDTIFEIIPVQETS